MTTEINAKTVIDDKFWIVESNGTKLGTIQKVDEAEEVVYVHDDQRERFPSIRLLANKYNIKFGDVVEKSAKDNYDVYGYPSAYKPFNTVYDVKRKLPLFSKNDKSKSMYCAGYYLIKFSDTWVRTFCPKSITLNRYEFHGPFKTEQAAKDFNAAL